MSSQAAELSGYSILPEPDLLFADNRVHKHPLLGLIANGPYGLRFGAPSKVRLAIVAPLNDMGKLEGLVAELSHEAKPVEAKNYYPTYPGFNEVFRTPVATPDNRLVLQFPDELDTHAQNGDKIALARSLFDCIAQLKGIRSEFDVALIYLPEGWAACFEGEGIVRNT